MRTAPIGCSVSFEPIARAAKKQQGISFVLIDMKTPGIEVHPILTLGDQHHVNSVTLTDVRVPVANRIGEENDGLDVCKRAAHARTHRHRRRRAVASAGRAAEAHCG